MPGGLNGFCPLGGYEMYLEPLITIYEKNISFHACAGNGISHQCQ